jgi:hypothetical protein
MLIRGEGRFTTLSGIWGRRKADANRVPNGGHLTFQMSGHRRANHDD